MRYAAVATLVAIAASREAVATEDVVGIWLTAGGNSQVRIAPCGAARCGTIVWTKREAYDTKNPSPALQSRSLVGIRMISDARPTGDSWTGSLYNPLDGGTYSGTMRVHGAELELSGCVLGGLICKAQTWTRVR